MDAQVAVIGAGIVGLATATHLLDAGIDVVLIEADQPGCAQSSGDYRIVRLTHANPAHIRPAHAALKGWSAWERRWGARCVTPVGLVCAGPGAPARAQALRDAGHHAEPLTGVQARAATFGQPSRSAFLDPAAGILDLRRAVELLSSTLTLHTVIAAVDRVEHDGTHAQVHMTAGDPITCERVIVCAGQGTQPIAQASGAHLPGVWRRHARYTYAAAADVDTAGWSAWIDETFYALPIPGVGAAVGIDLDPDPVGVSDTEMIELTQADTTALVASLMPDLDASSPVATEVCAYIDTPDLGHDDGTVGYTDGPVLWVHGRNVAKMAPSLGAELAAWAQTGALAHHLKRQP